MKLVTAVFLEKSIFFISKYPAKLSAVILGLKDLISPFKWFYTLIPILPGDLLGILDSPLPILVGITQESYERLKIDYELDSNYIESKIWVMLDDVQTPV